MKYSTMIAATVGAACFAATSYADTVSTAFGAGGDLEMREHSNSKSDSTSQNTRTSSGGDRNEIVALKFDLSGYTLADLTSVTLNLTSFRLDTSTRVVDLYAVNYGTIAPEGGLTPDTWNEGNITTFGSMPGLLATDANYLTQSIDLANVTSLGQLNMPGSSIAEGGIATFNFAATTAFINAYAGNTGTFLLAAGNTSTGQYRTGTRESTATATSVLTGAEGFIAPYLEFGVVPEPTTFALLGLGGLALAFARRRA